MNIKSKFLLLITPVLVLTALFYWLFMSVVAENIISSWVERYAKKQVQYDKVRMLLPLIQEVGLSKEFAQLASLKAWAQSPDNEQLKDIALKEADAFSRRFSSGSYFVALKKNGHYYYNNRQEDYQPDPYRYTLSRSKPSDAWFFELMNRGIDLYLNVNPDVELRVVKLWSDVLLRDSGEILGVVGTGLNLDTFLNEIFEKQDISSAIVFTNGEGVIQLYQQRELIDFSTITKQEKDKKFIFQLMDDVPSRHRLKARLALAKAQPDTVQIATVYKDGCRQLASIIYIPEIEWFEVNFIDVEHFLPLSEFSGLLLIFFASLAVALIAVYVLLTVIVTKPLAELESSMHALKKSRYQEPKLSRFAGLEIKRLVAYYQQMSKSILEYQHDLEDKVTQRTEALNRLSKSDPLTGLYNRRGFEDYLAQSMLEWQKKRQVFGLINVDINRFKQVNDQYGHRAGDQVLQKVATRLSQLVGDKGVVARWGGDEFLLLIKSASIGDIEPLAEQLSRDREALQIVINDQRLFIELSLGSTLVQNDDSLEDMLHRADTAMYKMKFLDR